jgi:hypothetical protein
MVEDRPAESADRPRLEPEVIPPGEARARWDDSFEGRARGRVYVARIGPAGLFAAVLAIAFLAAVVLVLLLGAFLILIPIAGLLLAAAIFSSWWRGVFRRRP